MPLNPAAIWVFLYNVGPTSVQPMARNMALFTRQFFPVISFSKSCSSSAGMWCDESLIMLHSADKKSWKSWAYVALKWNGLRQLQQACACPPPFVLRLLVQPQK